jgi:hypothetical protein
MLPAGRPMEPSRLSISNGYFPSEPVDLGAISATFILSLPRDSADVQGNAEGKFRNKAIALIPLYVYD